MDTEKGVEKMELYLRMVDIEPAKAGQGVCTICANLETGGIPRDKGRRHWLNVHRIVSGVEQAPSRVRPVVPMVNCWWIQLTTWVFAYPWMLRANFRHFLFY